MVKRCIFHVPGYLDPDRASASQIRPVKMKKAFEEIGYTVDIVQGYGKDRKKQIGIIKKKIKSGITYDFLYSESSTMPTLLTEKSHIPVYPFLDFGFLKYIKKQGIRVGLFYRDIYWKFPKYKKDVKGLRYFAAVFLYRYDLRQYKRILDKLYLPSQKMYEYIKYEIPENIVDVLPPGCEHTRIPKKKMGDNSLTLLYVGGIGGNYRFHTVLEVVSKMPEVNFILCCRKEEWKQELKNYEKYLNKNIYVYHEKGSGLEKLYEKADIGLVFLESAAYGNMSMPYKTFEYLGHELPVIASKGTVAGSFVMQENVGWVLEYRAETMKKLLESLLENQNKYLEKKKNVQIVAERHTWAKRAKKVEKDLGKMNVEGRMG